jgi:uncharacterized oxidoreductase
MPFTIHAEPLKQFVQAIFANSGCDDDEALRIAHYLVESNLVGHDSHGVIRVATYVDWLRSGKVHANRTPRIVHETDALAIIDAEFGFGQTAGEFATEAGIRKAKQSGIAAIALRNSGHLGRIGDWPLLAARAGVVSLHFVSTSGFGMLVAPFGGIDRRLSANPLAAGVPVESGSPIILDISTSAIAEGKIKVAYNKGVTVPDGCIIDNEGNATNDPNKFYTKPPGALLPFGGHKGYGLSVITEVLAEILTGNGCSNPQAPCLSNGLLSILLDPAAFPSDRPFASELQTFIQFVKSSRTVTENGEILMPGEVEERTRAARLANGIELDDKTWGQIMATADSVDVAWPA